MPAAADMHPVNCYDLTAVVADGQTTSGEVNLQGSTLCGVFLPSGMEGTSLAFTVSDQPGGTFLALTDAGDAVSYTVAASRYVALNPSLFAGVRYLKLVVGSQTGAVTVVLATRPV